MLSSVLMLPHGAEIIPTPGTPYNEAFRPLHEAMERAGREVAARKTDIDILLTPHGFTLSDIYVVYMHERFQALFYNLNESNTFGDIAARELWPGDRQTAERLLAAMKQKAIPADGLIQGSPTYALTLGWGETVPLHYLVAGETPRAVIVSLPRKRYEGLAEMQNNLADLGRVLLDLAESYPGAVSIVVSADMAHTHDATGPYGFHESADAFDHLVQQWAQKPTRGGLNELLALQPTAKACGMAGMCVLQSIFESANLTCAHTAYAAPTYFGMMVAHWS